MTKKAKLKAGMIFGIGMAVLFILQNLLANDHLTSKEITKIIAAGLIGGSIAGLLFGWLMGVFSFSKFVKQTTTIETEPGETILFETQANHFRNIEGVGGMLYLTNRRLIFKSHKLNIQNHQLSINLTDIHKIDSYKVLRIFNTGFFIKTNRNTTEKFVVEQPGEWIKQLAETRNGHLHGLAINPASE